MDDEASARRNRPPTAINPQHTLKDVSWATLDAITAAASRWLASLIAAVATALVCTAPPVDL